MGIHTNTVAYRVQRAEKLLGRSVHEQRLRLHVALRLARALNGAGVVEPLGAD